MESIEKGIISYIRFKQLFINEKTNYTIMKFNWSESVIWLCLLSTTFSLCSGLISDYTGIDSWLILYFGIGLLSVAVLILIYRIILKFKKNKK